MKDLAKKYKISIVIINKRINELTNEKDKLSLSSSDPEKDPDIIELQERLRPLMNMLNDLREITKEVEHYFDRSWWRSAKYTLNKNTPRPAIYSEPVYDTGIDKRGRKRKHEDVFGSGYSIVTYGKAKKSCGDVLRRRKNNASNS